MIRAIKGTRDILPPDSAAWNAVEEVAREVFRTFNYREIRTPIFEATSLFARGVGEDTDIVGKEMYTFTDRDDSSLTLRPEATASVMRSYIEHRLDQSPGLTKLYYIGPMFRRERPQKGRYRQFFQIGAEAIGSESPVVDAEVIEMVVELLKRVGLTGFELLLNSVGCRKCRPQFLAMLRERLAEVAPSMCEDCQRRATTNPLRVLDCKVPADQPIIDALPSILDHLCTECAEHFAAVRGYLDGEGRVPRIPYEVRPRLVRGLDYYMRTTFEITHGALGAQNSVLGGGRYDGLAEAIGSKVAAPGIGFSIGEDRLILSLTEADPEKYKSPVDVVLAPMGAAAEAHAWELAAELRAAGISVERSVDKKLKRTLDVANRTGARFALIVGEDEVTSGNYSLKEMATGEQVQLQRDELAGHILGPFRGNVRQDNGPNRNRA